MDDAHLRRSFRSCDGFLQTKRASHFGDHASFCVLRHVGEAICHYSLSKLLDLLEQRLTERGVTVHWASMPQEANTIFLALARRHGADRMIKGKPMVSEEIEINHRIAE